ncbi:MAG TPA: ABC transporter permease [Thermoanaerobaculia bacterium]|nr:ABC transporter permease [Thermoanaerobaculia bacterium]
MESLRRIAAILWKELRQLRRDRLTFAMIIGIPTIQVLLFGYAIRQDVRHLPAGIADLAHTQSSRQLRLDAAASQVVDIVKEAAGAGELEAMLEHGEIAVGIYVPPDFERRLIDGRPAAQLLIDGSDPVYGLTARALAELPVGPRRGVAAGRGAPTFELRTYYNPEARSEVNIVPALIGVILTLTMVLFTAVAIVRERERGNLELLITTPVRSIELMAGKIVPYVLIGLVQVTLILIVGAAVFQVPVRGRVVDLYLAALVFIAASLSLGLLISTAAKTQFQSVQMTVFFFLPSLLLSGFMFPFVSMPAPARFVGELLPLTHFVRIVRGIVLRGAPLGDLSGEIWPLLAFFASSLTLAILRFRKRLD